MNPDFPSPMPPMAGDAEQLRKEGQGDQVLDRPECLPAFRVPHLTDRVAIVQLGFRSRPLRDGGGGRLNPPFRRISTRATLGALIMTLTRPWIDKVRMSLASATTHPFQEADLEELRAILGPRHLHERCPGQPFLLDLVSHLASLSGDPDWEFPLTLKEGVPLGVSDPTLTSPGVWPTKEELKGEAWLGEDPPPPVAHDNYPTANQPFTRNEPWTWWTGPSLAPRRQRGAAANRRNFARAPLQGLMSRTRSGRSTMAQKGEQTRTSRLTRRRRPPHRWLETASMPSTGSGQRRTILIYSERCRCRGPLRGTPTAPACPQVRGP